MMLRLSRKLGCLMCLAAGLLVFTGCFGKYSNTVRFLNSLRLLTSRWDCLTIRWVFTPAWGP